VDSVDLTHAGTGHTIQWPDGGWPAEAKYSTKVALDWGGTSKKHMNEWVTADALGVLKAFGRLS